MVKYLLQSPLVTVTLYAAEDGRKLDREKFHSTHANSHLPNGELGGYGYNANNIYTLLITTYRDNNMGTLCSSQHLQRHSSIL